MWELLAQGGGKEESEAPLTRQRKPGRVTLHGKAKRQCQGEFLNDLLLCPLLLIHPNWEADHISRRVTEPSVKQHPPGSQPGPGPALSHQGGLYAHPPQGCPRGCCCCTEAREPAWAGKPHASSKPEPGRDPRIHSQPPPSPHPDTELLPALSYSVRFTRS